MLDLMFTVFWAPMPRIPLYWIRAPASQRCQPATVEDLLAPTVTAGFSALARTVGYRGLSAICQFRRCYLCIGCNIVAGAGS